MSQTLISVTDGPTRKRTFGIAITATIVFFVANVAFFLNRGVEDNYYPSNYATIYYPTDRPVIQEWKVVEGGIEGIVEWNAPVEGWRILKDGEPYAENRGANPFFPAPYGDEANHSYSAIPQPEGLSPPLEFKIRYLPESFHVERGLPRPDSYTIMTDLPTGRFEQHPVTFWVDDYEYMSREDLEFVDKILLTKVGIRAGDSVVERLEKLMVHLRNQLGQTCRGAPPLDFRWKTPLQVYKEMDTGVSKGWCTQQGQMFVFFANRAGLSTRMIQGSRLMGASIILSGHVWVETWIPEEGLWAWLDPSYGIVYAKDQNGRMLNTMELAGLRQHSAWEGVTAHVFKDWAWPDLEGEEGTFVEAHFPDVGGVVLSQFVTSSIYKWRRPPNVEDIRSDYGMLFKNSEFFWGNLERYYFKPPLALANFPTDGARTYFIRHFLLWGFLLSFAATMVLHKRSGRKRR